jgi:hypothetical protein
MKRSNIILIPTYFLAGCGMVLDLLQPARGAAQQSNSASRSSGVKTVVKTAAGQRSFSTAEQAAQALLAAAEAGDNAALLALFGPSGKEIVNSGDPVQDKNRRAAFIEKAKQRMKIEPDATNPKRATIAIGDDDFPFPVPVVESGGQWRFDTQQGRRELLARRIGGNELEAIKICNAYVMAQHQFAAEDQDRRGVHEYAQKFISSPGKKDGLYWDEAEGGPASPIADLVNQAAEEGYDTTGVKPVPYHGYYFRILKGQGPRAAGGATDYMVRGLMIGGFGLIAWPAEYGASGIKTFMVNQAGIVREKDLGPSTATAAKTMQTFNPGTSWKAVK